MTEGVNNSSGRHPGDGGGHRWRFGLRTLFVASLAICMLLVFGRYLVRKAEEFHARSCLIEVEELADKAVSESIPQKNYGDAIAAAQYIKSFYPPGAVLPEDHPFAGKYASERQRQIDRVRFALENAVGDDDVTVWEDWKAAIEDP